VFVNFNFESKFGFYSFNIARADSSHIFSVSSGKSAPTILVIRIPFSADFNDHFVASSF
jgi:hypothetical protein